MSLSISFLLFSFPKLFIREFRQKEMKRQKKNAQGAVLMAGASRIWKFVKSNLLGEHDVDLLEPAFDFLRFFSTSFEPRAVDRSVFCHLSPRPAPPAPQSHIISAALRVAALLQVSSLIFCVLRDERLRIDRSIRLSIFSPRLLLLTSATPLLYF